MQIYSSTKFVAFPYHLYHSPSQTVLIRIMASVLMVN